MKKVSKAAVPTVRIIMPNGQKYHLTVKDLGLLIALSNITVDEFDPTLSQREDPAKYLNKIGKVFIRKINCL